MDFLFCFFCIWIMPWYTSANLLSSLKITASDTPNNIKANPERLFRYYTQSGNPQEPLPIYIDTWGNGLSKVAWCDGDNVHVTTIGTDDKGGQDHKTPGNSVRGLVAHDDGTSTVLLKDGTMDCYLVKMSSTGTQLFKTSVDNRCKDFSLGGGRLAWDGQKYAAYYKVHENGHEGDAYKTITGDGQSVDTVSSWGCSHSMEERLTYNPTTDKFGRFCLSDAYPAHGYHYNHNSKNLFAATANEGGYVAGGLGGVVATETGWLFTVTVPQGGGSMDTNTDVGLFHLSHTNTIALTGPMWLTSTANIWEMGSHITKYGKVPDRYLVGWIEKNSGAYFTRSADKFILAIIDSSGKLYGSPTDISSLAMFHERSDFVTFTNGDPGWVASWTGSPPSPSYSAEQKKFYIVRVTTSCEPNPCTNPPICRASPGICTYDAILGPQCDYSAKSPFGEKCQDDSGECDAGGNCDTCLANGQTCPSNNAPSCREGQGTCVGTVGASNRECQYSTLASANTVCPGGVCNSAGACTGDCNDPNCETCGSTAPATCTVCSNNKILENGCCLDSICLNVDGVGGNSGEYALAGTASGKSYYYNSAANKYLTFYCCGWGWCITNSAGGGSAYSISDNLADTAIGASGSWRNGKTVTITKCDLCAGITCNSPPQCYKGPGVCNQCGVCDYVLEPSGAPCTLNGVNGACDGLGACGSTIPETPAPTTASPTTRSPTRSPTKSPTTPPVTSPTRSPTLSPTDPPTSSPTTRSPTRSPTRLPTKSPTIAPRECLAQDSWPTTPIGSTSELSCPSGTTGRHYRVCNSGGIWGTAVKDCAPVAVATCDDGEKNGDETGIDCGGATCDVCKFCQGIVCIPNGECNELKQRCDCQEGWTGDRCEIPPANKCTGIECGSYGTCVEGSCVCSEGWEGARCDLQVYGNCANGIKDGDEAGVDCGGTRCDGKICNVPSFAIVKTSPCSVTCGIGTETRTVVCKDANGVTQPDDKLCEDANAHPISKEVPCDTKVQCAVYTWTTGIFGECSSSCGGGQQFRPVECMSSIGQKRVGNELCAVQDKPIETLIGCNSEPCEGPHWEVPQWGECSRTCGGGIQTREKFCVDKDNKMVNETECVKDKTIYATEQACNIFPCETYNWITCPDYEPCTATCGGGYGMLGVQKREVFCKNLDLVVVDSSLCSNIAEKPTVQLFGCNPQACSDFNWMADAPWGECKDGKRTRSFHCHAADGSNAEDQKCIDANIPYPPQEMECQENTCPVWDDTIIDIGSAEKILLLSHYFFSIAVFLVFF